MQWLKEIFAKISMPPFRLMRKYMPAVWCCTVSAWILFASVAPNLAGFMVSFLKATCLPETVIQRPCKGLVWGM